MRPLAGRERRLIAIGLAAGALAVLWLGLVGPLVRGFGDRAAERRVLVATYGRDRALIAAMPVWRVLAERQTAAAGQFQLAAPSQEAAVEALKDKLQRLAADEGFKITSLADLAAAPPPGGVRIRADMQLTLTQLVESLRRLETEESYVVVEYISVSADRALQSGKLSSLDVRLEISAPYRAPGPRPS
ncbi:MAG: type II secretion system protein GspM [Caulobacteraceae bacterium]